MGLLNGAIIIGLGIDAFVTTPATLNIGRGLVYIVSNQYNVNVPDGSAFFELGRGHIGQAPNSVVIFLVLFVVLYVVEKRTVFGRSIRAIGGNQGILIISAVALYAAARARGR